MIRVYKEAKRRNESVYSKKGNENEDRKHYPLTIPIVTSGMTPSGNLEAFLPKPIAAAHLSQAHLLNFNTSSSSRSFRTCNSRVTTRDCFVGVEGINCQI